MGEQEEVEQTEPLWSYKTDTAVYDVGMLSQEAQVSFQYLAETETEMRNLSKRIDILRAASTTLKKVIEVDLVDSAIIETYEPYTEGVS